MKLLTGSAGHVLGQPGGFRLAVGDDRVFNLAVDLLLGSIGGGDKSVKTGQLKQETNQANAARADLYTDQMESENQSMQKGKSRTPLKERSHFGTDSESVMP